MARSLGWVAVAIVLCLTACAPQHTNPPDFVGTPIVAGALDGRFDLVDHRGRARRMEDFRGKVVMLFFGYTHCPDVCPTTMVDLAKVMDLLGRDRSGVQVLFVTLDPERDTRELLAQYVPAFDPSFLGLRGDSASLEKVAKQFNVYSRRKDSSGRSGYTIDHSAGIYVFDRQGVPRLYLNYGQKPKDIAHDVELLAREN